jgi:hypothetical protein
MSPPHVERGDQRSPLSPPPGKKTLENFFSVSKPCLLLSFSDPRNEKVLLDFSPYSIKSMLEPAT